MANTPNTMKRNEERPGSASFGGQQHPQGQGTGIADKAKDMASSMTDKARDAASAVSERASDMASNVGQKAESATAAVGSGMKSIAESIREHAPSGGMLHSATAGVADSLESGGRYLEETRLNELGKDFTNLVRRNPVPALFLGIGFGFLLACATRR